MLENNQALLNESIDYLEHFEGIPEEVLIRNIQSNSNHWHNNSFQLQHVHIYMMVMDTDLQHLTDQTVGVGLKTFKTFEEIIAKSSECEQIARFMLELYTTMIKMPPFMIKD